MTQPQQPYPKLNVIEGAERWKAKQREERRARREAALVRKQRLRLLADAKKES